MEDWGWWLTSATVTGLGGSVESLKSGESAAEMAGGEETLVQSSLPLVGDGVRTRLGRFIHFLLLGRLFPFTFALTLLMLPFRVRSVEGWGEPSGSPLGGGGELHFFCTKIN